MPFRFITIFLSKCYHTCRTGEQSSPRRSSRRYPSMPSPLCYARPDSRPCTCRNGHILVNMAYFLLPLTGVAVLETHFVHFHVPCPCARFPILGPYFTVLPDVETRGTFCHIMDRMSELVQLRLHKRINSAHFFTHVLLPRFGLSSRWPY